MKSACIIAKLPEKYWKFFPKDRGGADFSDPHITILFIGSISDKDLKIAIPIISEIADSADPIKCSFGKVGHFPAGDDGVPYYVEIIAEPGLEKLHKDLKKALEEVGLSIEHKWPEYRAHATLKYMPEGKIFDGDPPIGKFEITNITTSIIEK